jgi:tRNA A37 methylthiotransferase MiaB
LVINESPMKPKVCLVTLGCAKNLVDSENMLGLLKARGFDCCPGPGRSRDRDHQHVRIH